LKKIFYISLGFISLGIGIAGIVLPVVPTTPLVLLSAFCFSRSSEKFDIWLRQTKVYKYYAADFVESRSIAPARKKSMIWQIYILMGISIYFAPLMWLKLGLLIGTIVGTYVLFYVVPDKIDE
jgi:Uncharacterized protein conserved in bacteria